MSDKFKAIVIDQQGEKFSREIKELDTGFLDQGDVLVKVDYSDLNYKDALILNDGGKLVRDFPRIPGIDFSGKVLESNASEFKKDDEVIAIVIRDSEGFEQSAQDGVVNWLDERRPMLQEFDPVNRHTIPMTGDLIE